MIDNQQPSTLTGEGSTTSREAYTQVSGSGEAPVEGVRYSLISCENESSEGKAKVGSNVLT